MNATSSYLNKPLRTLAEALADRRKARETFDAVALGIEMRQIFPGIVAGEGFGGKRRCG